MDIKKFFQSIIFKWVIGGLAVLAVALVVFRFGMLVGARKAEFSGRWGENYHRNFGGPRSGFFRDFGDRDFIEGSGVVGQIIKIDDKTLVVKGRDNVEKIVLVSDKTVIRRFKDTLKPADLKTDDFIVIIGEPNESGQIEAKLIRIMPPPMTRGMNKKR